MIQLNFVVAAFVLSLAFGTASAQLYFGIRAGGQSTTLISDGSKLSWKSGFHAGVYASYDFNRNISVVGDLLYSDKGYSKYFLGQYAGKSNLKYLSLPLMLQYRANGRFSVLAGGEFDALISNYLSDAQVIPVPGGGVMRPVSDRYLDRRTDVGIVAGLAFQVSPHMNLMLRYARGYRNLASDKQDSYYNEAFQLSIGYSFRKKIIDSSYIVRASERRAIISFGMRQGFSSYSLTGSGIDRIFSNNTGLQLTNRVGMMPVLNYASISLNICLLQLA